MYVRVEEGFGDEAAALLRIAVVMVVICSSDGTEPL
jgi:hypothetical protein